jgi:hypothetical protein
LLVCNDFRQTSKSFTADAASLPCVANPDAAQAFLQFFDLFCDLAFAIVRAKEDVIRISAWPLPFPCRLPLALQATRRLPEQSFGKLSYDKWRPAIEAEPARKNGKIQQAIGQSVGSERQE